MHEKPGPTSIDKLRGFLADTWWYALSSRMSEKDFTDLAKLRLQQGFSAVQLVVGIPPEVGPDNVNAASENGFAWTLQGEFNHAYLELARDRITVLNDLGLLAIVYGAWGHQIEWLGPDKMAAWWAEIVTALDDKNVVYCITGESDIWLGQADLLLPDLSTGDLLTRQSTISIPVPITNVLKKLRDKFFTLEKWQNPELRETRHKEWGEVLARLDHMTNHPIIVHPVCGQYGLDSVDNSDLLSANTTQTGHSDSARDSLWKMPYANVGFHHRIPFINLEPWYEGILGKFYAGDQLYAYWSSMLSGSASFCYGAHGIWNVGDGRFLAHWGKQTFEQAVSLRTPELLGASHAVLASCTLQDYVEIEKTRKNLIAIHRSAMDTTVSYYPEVSRAAAIPAGQYWLPLSGKFVKRRPSTGQLVVIGS